jgi:sec-independent protein translocase protein TatA
MLEMLNTTLSFTSLTIAWLMPNGPEWIILLILGLLIFGRRLPEVGRSLGKGIVEFKKGIQGIEDDIDEQSTRPATSRRIADEPRQELPPRRSQARVEREPEDDPHYAAAEPPRRDDPAST